MTSSLPPLSPVDRETALAVLAAGCGAELAKINQDLDTMMGEVLDVVSAAGATAKLCSVLQNHDAITQRLDQMTRILALCRPENDIGETGTGQGLLKEALGTCHMDEQRHRLEQEFALLLNGDAG